MPTLPNGIVTPLGTDSADPIAVMTLVANGFSDALGGLGIGKRQPRLYTVTDQTAKAALAGAVTLTVGDQAYLEDSKWFEMFTAAGWKITRTTVAVPFIPATSGFLPGNGVSNFAYSLSGDVCTVRGYFTFGSTTAFTSGLSGFYLPFACNYVTTGSANVVVGSVLATKSGGGFYQGIAKNLNDTSGASAVNMLASIYFDMNMAAGSLNPFLQGAPFTWAAGDQISVDIRFRRQM